jgi:hypothetical protein
MHRKILYGLTYLAATLSLAHHIDHVIRHNAVGWPLTSEVNAFTMSLIIYPIIITGLLLYQAGRVGPGFWALVSGGGAAFVSAVHFGPYAVEPPAMILDRYDSPIAGWLAFILLVTFVSVLAVTSQAVQPEALKAAVAALPEPWRRIVILWDGEGLRGLSATGRSTIPIPSCSTRHRST